MPPTQPQLEIGNGQQRGNDVGFTNQGQVDWVAFSSTLFSATMSVWQRLSGNDVHPITFGGALALGTRFRLGDVGQQQIDDAIAKLGAKSSYGKILQFGFGVQAMIRTLGETKEGINFIGLTSCLADIHSEDMVARILSELWGLEDFPNMYQPSHGQFLQVVKTCTEVVLGSSFSQVVDVMTGDLGRFRNGADFKSIMSASDAADIAKAIQGLFKITLGKVDQITAIGGTECILIASLGLWLFNFRVYVEDERGALIFKNVDLEEDAHVSVKFVRNYDYSRVLVTTTTYLLPPSTEDQHEIFVETGEVKALRLIVRTPWDGCLVRVFGRTFKNLCILEIHLAAYLGGLARTYAALARCESDVAHFSRKHYVDFSITNYGLGFLDTISNTLPEIARLDNFLDLAREQAEASFKQALNSVELAINSIKSICTCGMCEGKTNPSSVIVTEKDREPCLVALAMTIRHIACLMASVVQDSSFTIDPSIHGLEHMYDWNLGLWKRCLGGSDLLSGICGLPVKSSGQEKLDNIDLDTSLSIADMRCLLTGFQPPIDELDYNYKQTAVAANGVCLYIDALCSPSCDPEKVRKVHVIAGHIARGTR